MTKEIYVRWSMAKTRRESKARMAGERGKLLTLSTDMLDLDISKEETQQMGGDFSSSGLVKAKKVGGCARSEVLNADLSYLTLLLGGSFMGPLGLVLLSEMPSSKKGRPHRRRILSEKRGG